MVAPPTELISRIAELQAEFQRIAEQHPWLTLGVPQPDTSEASSYYRPVVGESTLYHAPTYSGIYGVLQPDNFARRAVANHVEALTSQACELIRKVLEHNSQIPANIKQRLSEWERDLPGGFAGWVCWLFYAGGVHSLTRIEHYAQAAATALLRLRECCDLPRVRCVKSDRSVHLDGKLLAAGLDDEVFAYFAILADSYPDPITFSKMQKKSSELQGVNQSRMKTKISNKLSALVKIIPNKGHVLMLPC